MKKALLTVVAALCLGACTSVDSAVISASEIASNGEAVAVVQGDAIGLSALLHFVPIVSANLDTAVNRVLIQEAKAMGASKVQLVEANTMPTHGIYHLLTCPTIILCLDTAHATGVAIK